MESHDDSIRLPHLGGGTTYLTDGGLETCLIFHDGMDLPAFASFPLASTPEGRARLVTYYEEYLATARDLGMGFVLEAPTWRANVDWAAALGLSPEEMLASLDEVLDLMVELRDDWAGRLPIVLSGCVGPRGDGYVPGHQMTATEAERYHAVEIERMASRGVDLVSAFTLNYVDEAVGVVTAAARAGVPVVISFTVETDGRLPDGTTLGEAIEATDAATGSYPSYYMVNCAHPTHMAPGIEPGAPWTARIRGLRANASTLSHAELDEATELDDGDPDDLAKRYVALREALPDVVVLGGCCGTDHRHVEAIARSWSAAAI